ncbi:restriction endonuclease subunit S [Alkalicella caledoniensis]|uniref:Restriction endonuclease subunit S n=1 Tax=Alkalicella caledoniensis TaxID=2731377 RepID=A0A7G9WB56_ALKCA|nr:restriction endonuclease subunit S [Alkalicella caledoniensis]QNO15918.1 restriction endonuclease subunit S [Alkalicella caledoniensis]
MSRELKPYEEYKETEYDWLGPVPNHWNKLSIRNITELSSERNRTRNDLELLSVYREYGVIKKSSRDDNHNVESEDLTNYKLVDKGYLVLNKMKMWQGSLGVSRYKGIVSPAYIVCKLRKDLHSDYINYLLRAAVFKTIYNRLSYGVRVGQWDMRYEDFKNIKLYIPSKEEQDQIVRYLDNKLVKISKFIKNKKKLIELLKEQKQAVINQAVTKGLDPTAKMKPSGIGWLGDIPEDWEVKRIKHFSRVNPSINNKLKKINLEDEVVFLSMDKISDYGEIVQNELKQLKYVKTGYTAFAKGDVVIAKITPCFENGKGACLSKLNTDIGYGTTELVVLRPNKRVISEFLYWITRTSYFRNLGIEVMTGSAGQKRVPVEFVTNFQLGIPDVEEQNKIVKLIEEKISILSKLLEKVNKEIDLMAEYRTSLISNVVTGKVDVRHIEIENLTEDVGESFSDLDDLEVEDNDLLAEGE